MRRRVVMVAVVLAVAGCTAGDPPAASTTRPELSITPAPSPEPSTIDIEVPIALAVHLAAPAVALTLADARAVLDGRIGTWRELGGGAGPIQLIAAPGLETEAPAARPGRSAAAAARAAERDPLVIAVVAAQAVGPAVRVLRVGGRHPLREPARYPLTGSVPAGVGAAAPTQVTTVTVVGDMMLGRRVGRALAAQDDFAAALRPTRRRLAGADLTVGNLESTLSQAGAPRQGNDSFAADPRVLAGLRDAGFDVLSLANNHTGDYGPTALIETVERVADARILPVGAGRNVSAAREPAIVERNGIRFGFLAFNAIGETPAPGSESPGAVRIRMQPRTGPLNAADLRAMRASIRRLQDLADVVIVLPHWGQQYTYRAVPDQRRVARALLDAGADLVVGGHPHWVQGIEFYDGKFIAHSLGNYVFDMDFSRETREGVILELVFWGSELKAAELVPVVIGSDFAPRMVTGASARRILRQMWQVSGLSAASSAASR